MNRDQFSANVLYNNDVKEEIEWRKQKENKHDVELLDKLIMEINGLGYNLKYEADLRWKDIRNQAIIAILDKYLYEFDNQGISSGLIKLIGYRNFYDATAVIIKHYKYIKKIDSPDLKGYAGAHDNALYNIKDKRYINEYLDFLKNKDDFSNLPFTMIMLAKWNIVEAKEFFICYLNSQNRESVFTSIECLSKYKDDDEVLAELNKHLLYPDTGIVKAIRKALIKLR